MDRFHVYDVFLIGGTTPIIVNFLGNDGYIERSIYFTSIVLLFIIAFFIILILYLNFSVERTSFILKIVGITFVTVLIIMQVLVYISNQDKEFEYDTLSRIRVEKALEGERVKGGISYIFKWNIAENSFDKKNTILKSIRIKNGLKLILGIRCYTRKYSIFLKRVLGNLF